MNANLDAGPTLEWYESTADPLTEIVGLAATVSAMHPVLAPVEAALRAMAPPG